MDESLKIDGSLVQLLLRHLAVTHLHSELIKILNLWA